MYISYLLQLLSSPLFLLAPSAVSLFYLYAGESSESVQPFLSLFGVYGAEDETWASRARQVLCHRVVRAFQYYYHAMGCSKLHPELAF